MIGVVRAIGVGEARPLRHQLLRPGRPASELVFPGDDAADALHVGAFEDERLVGIGTVLRDPPPDAADERAWRIRGMATLPEVRGRGYGGLLLERCLQHAVNHGGHLVWCNARVGAIGFYRRYGFATAGEVFEVPEIGEHVFMSRPVS